MADELPCPSDWEETSGTATGLGHGDTKSAARTSARGRVAKHAFASLGDLVAGQPCAEGCRLVVDFTLEPADLGKAVPGAPNGFDCPGAADWTARYRCDTKAFPAGAAQSIELQDLDCEERPIGRGTAKAKGSGPQAPAAVDAAAKDLARMLSAAIESALIELDAAGIQPSSKIRCPKKCPNLSVRVRLGPETTVLHGPPPGGGDWTCDMSQEWHIRARCTS